MTLLTGIKREHLQNARTLEEVMVDLRTVLGNNCILVGHGLKSDISWLGLRAGIDFVDKKDTAKLFSISSLDNDKVTITPSLRHLCMAMFGIDMQEGIHSPVVDALYAMKLYQLYCNAKMKRFITVNNIQYNMNESNDMNDLIKLAERDLNVYKLIQRKFKARQRWYLADTLCCMNAISYIKDESLFIFEDKYKLNDNKNIKRRGNRGGRGARGKKKI